MRTVYLDNNATTQLAPEVLQAMEPFWTNDFGNPSSSHAKGVRAREAVEESRAAIARNLGVSAEEVVFTSGATESINLALKGAVGAARRTGGGAHIVTSLAEHDAVLESCAALGDEGYATTYLRPDAGGRVTAEQIAAALRPETVLVSIMHVNNELGTAYPLRDIGRVVKEYDPGIVMFSDGVQAFGKIPVDLTQIDLYALSAHKLHGPKGVGALFVRKGTRLRPLFHGGGQESGIRSGTENVAGIAGFAKAAELACRDMAKNSAHMSALKEAFLSGLRGMSGIAVNSPEDALPTTVSVAFLGREGSAVRDALNKRGIFVSTGSACSSKEPRVSHVLDALPVSDDIKRGSVRFGFSRYTSTEEITATLNALRSL